MANKRLDSRARFQHATFTRKLNQARSYKRSARPRPEGRLHASLEKVGLASLLAQLLTAAVLIVLAYILYVPNPLFLQTVYVDGLSTTNQDKAQEVLEKYFAELPWYVPTHNWLFVDENALGKAIADNVPAVYKFNHAEKNFKTRTVHVSVVEKYERYRVVRPGDEMVLYNDGTVKTVTLNELPAAVPVLAKPKTMPQSGELVTVSINQTRPVTVGETYFSQDFIALIEQAATLFPEKANQPLGYFEITVPTQDTGPDNSRPFTEAWMQSGISAALIKIPEGTTGMNRDYKVILEPGLDIAAAADRLALLLSQTAEDRYRKLLYIDLRLPNRAFLCLINTPCATAPTLNQTNNENQ